MKRISLYIFMLAVTLTTIAACGESEEERLAREQARLDSLRQVEMQKAREAMAAYEDSVANAQAEMPEEETSKSESGYTLLESGPFVVQVGAWRSEDKAQGFVNKWAERNYPSTYVVSTGDSLSGDIWFRVRVGYFKSISEAKLFGEELSAELNSGYWVANKD